MPKAQKNEPKKISKEYLESIKIDRKINELSYEVTFKLGFDPNKNDLLKYDNNKEFKNNFDFIKSSINKKLNNKYNLKTNKDRLKISLDNLEKIYKYDTKEISIYCQNEIYNKVNNKKLNIEIKTVHKNQTQTIENKELKTNINQTQKLKRRLKL